MISQQWCQRNPSLTANQELVQTITDLDLSTPPSMNDIFEELLPSFIDHQPASLAAPQFDGWVIALSLSVMSKFTDVTAFQVGTHSSHWHESEIAQSVKRAVDLLEEEGAFIFSEQQRVHGAASQHICSDAHGGRIGMSNQACLLWYDLQQNDGEIAYYPLLQRMEKLVQKSKDCKSLVASLETSISKRSRRLFADDDELQVQRSGATRSLLVTLQTNAVNAGNVVAVVDRTQFRAKVDQALRWLDKALVDADVAAAKLLNVDDLMHAAIGKTFKQSEETLMKLRPMTAEGTNWYLDTGKQVLKMLGTFFSPPHYSSQLNADGSITRDNVYHKIDQY